jgi:hypothetical protein
VNDWKFFNREGARMFGDNGLVVGVRNAYGVECAREIDDLFTSADWIGAIAVVTFGAFHATGFNQGPDGANHRDENDPVVPTGFVPVMPPLHE